MEYWLEVLPERFSLSLPPFDEHGNIPPGDYAPTREDFESHFVRAGDSEVRLRIYQGWSRHREALRGAGLADSARELLDGSFTSSKEAPGDMDLVVEIPIDSIEQASDHRASRLLKGPATRRECHCDAYPIWCLPREHEHYELVTAALVRYSTKWFGMDRQGRLKGRIWATVGGLR